MLFLSIISSFSSLWGLTLLKKFYDV